MAHRSCPPLPRRQATAVTPRSRSRVLCAALTLATVAICTCAAAARAAPVEAVAPGGKSWRDAALADLQALHDLIEANSPGPVDPRNTAYREWLKQGLRQARPLAEQATGWSTARLALQFYANGFRDGHLQVVPVDGPGYSVQPLIWPGFLTRLGTDGRTTVAVTAPGSPVRVDDELLGCDGIEADRLTRDRVDRYWVNADIPHTRALSSWRLFATRQDNRDLLELCRFRSAGAVLEHRLQWTSVSDTAFDAALDRAMQTAQPEAGVRVIGGVTFVSLPSFDQPADRMKALVNAVRTRRPAIVASPIVVLDVRGNGGGNSSWGQAVAEALWGAKPVRAVVNSFDWTTEWRASRLNIRLTRESAAHSAAAGNRDDAAYRYRMADRMQAALDRAQALAAVPAPATSPGLRPGTPSPFKGRVFLLTDHHCASACLDFADIVLRMPGVQHAGLPTSADAVYIDNLAHKLPSGLFELSWGVKVYRNRIRGHNAWYSPQHLWTGGRMLDEDVAAWLAGLR